MNKALLKESVEQAIIKALGRKTLPAILTFKDIDKINLMKYGQLSRGCYNDVLKVFKAPGRKECLVRTSKFVDLIVNSQIKNQVPVPDKFLAP